MKAFLTLGLVVFFSSGAFAARYEVPVDESLKTLATFELSNFQKIVNGEEIKIKYDLPYVLTGNKEAIELEGYINQGSQEFLMTGDKASAVCSNQYSSIVCRIEYTNLSINAENATRAIKEMSKTSQEVSGRLEVMRAFSTDPVGFIFY